MDWLSEGFLVGASQTMMLTIVILGLRPANAVANRLLATYVGLESLHLFLLHLSYANPGVPPPLIRVLFNLRALSGPVLYLYVRALTEPGFRLQRRHLGHLAVMLPPVAWLAFLMTDPNWRDASAATLQQYAATIVMASFQSLLVVLYASLALVRLRAHRERLQQALSTVDELSLRWLRWLVTGLIVVHLVFLAMDALRLPGVLIVQHKQIVNLAITLLLIYLISLGGLRQPRVFTDVVRVALRAVEPDEPPAPLNPGSTDVLAERGKYLKSGLDEGRRQDIWQRLDGLLEREQPFLDPTLDLPRLARQLAVRPQELSETINTVRAQNFYELIAQCRVETAKRLLADPANARRKMLDIALSVGFSSQSTFYSQFKKLTGSTPTQYRDSLPARSG